MGANKGESNGESQEKRIDINVNHKPQVTMKAISDIIFEEKMRA